MRRGAVPCSGSEGWPSPQEMVDLGTRVMIAGSEPSTLVFSTDEDAVEVSACGALTVGWAGRFDRVSARMLEALVPAILQNDSLVFTLFSRTEKNRSVNLSVDRPLRRFPPLSSPRVAP